MAVISTGSTYLSGMYKQIKETFGYFGSGRTSRFA